MGQNLFIRVSAQTYDENAVPRSWPLVFAAAWPEPGMESGDPAAAAARKLAPDRQRGVLELVDAFSDFAHYADMPEDKRKAVIPVADKAAKRKQELEEALGDRDVKKAHALCGAIEEALDEAERALRGLNP